MNNRSIHHVKENTPEVIASTFALRTLNRRQTAIDLIRRDTLLVPSMLENYLFSLKETLRVKETR